jgi:4-diphosphocytidyl-2-C-methyl-D-erythritol kinase
MELVRDSHTRITLALDIVRRLTEGELAGYHELAVVKHQIDLHDTIRMRPAAAMSLRCDNPDVPTDNTNLCMRAARLLGERYGVDRAVAIVIGKRIPVMGGLAGGSANAATALAMLNDLWGLGLGAPALAELGRELGMDVPFYFQGGTVVDSETGRGVRPLCSSLSLDFVLAVPSFGVATAEAYRGLDYAETGKQQGLTRALVDAWEAGERDAVLGSTHNDFELSVFRAHPELAHLKQALLANGCPAAFLTGSGSTVVGVAHDASHAAEVRQALLGGGQRLAAVLCASTYHAEGTAPSGHPAAH